MLEVWNFSILHCLSVLMLKYLMYDSYVRVYLAFDDHFPYVGILTIVRK